MTPYICHWYLHRRTLTSWLKRAAWMVCSSHNGSVKNRDPRRPRTTPWRPSALLGSTTPLRKKSLWPHRPRLRLLWTARWTSWPPGPSAWRRETGVGRAPGPTAARPAPSSAWPTSTTPPFTTPPVCLSSSLDLPRFSVAFGRLKCSFTSTGTVGLLGDGSPRWPPRLSHSSWSVSVALPMDLNIYIRPCLALSTVLPDCCFLLSSHSNSLRPTIWSGPHSFHLTKVSLTDSFILVSFFLQIFCKEKKKKKKKKRKKKKQPTKPKKQQQKTPNCFCTFALWTAAHRDKKSSVHAVRIFHSPVKRRAGWLKS